MNRLVSFNSKNDFILNQLGLIYRIFQDLGLQEGKYDSTHATAKHVTLTQDQDGQPFSEALNYASAVVMLLYLVVNS